MRRQATSRVQPENKERNQRIASILYAHHDCLSQNRKIKEKLCGFSSQDFSPEIVFEALDLTNKGFLDQYDIKQFLNNDRIGDEDIVKLFIRYGAKPSEPKLTYLSYLNFLKPHFDYELGRDLLMRDTRKKGQQRSQKDQQEAVLLLLRELFLLNCICVAEHQDIKTVLMEEYMLNTLELREILGLDNVSPVKAIHQFVDCNSNYAIEEQQIKYLLSYLRIAEYELNEETSISALFLPIRLDMQQVFTNQQKAAGTGFVDKQRQKLHQNYDKKYIGRHDLSSTAQKLSFLNYIHPNSYQNQPPVRDTKQKAPHIRPRLESQYPSEDLIASEHRGLNVADDTKFKRSFQQIKQKGNTQDEQLDYSQVIASGVYKSQRPQQLINSSNVPIHTPVLEQFMHNSNIRHNLGEASPQRHPQPNEPKQLNMLLEESSFSQMSSSEAFERIPRKQTANIVVNKRDAQPQPTEKNLLHSNWKTKGLEVVSGHMDVSTGSGILNQFMRV